jgi:hypothetical protein
MFKQLKIYYILISLPFVLLLTGSAVFFDAIQMTITRNPHPQINYTIFIIICFGGCLIVINSRQLVKEARTAVDFSRAIHAKIDLESLQEIASGYTGAVACLFQMVASSTGRFISHQEQVAIENELTNARAGLQRRNALPQYLTGLLVGMGLLGTFIGLLATLNDISTLISSFAEIDMKTASPLVVFRTMIERMKAPMQSMGIAFSASMFGLLGSIILGLMMVGVRRLQGDIFSLLHSEVAHHIEFALSFESAVSANLTGGVAVRSGDEYKVLIRIEERLAEAARLQQRKLSSEIDDFQKQRADMLRALTEQAEASNNFRGELQELGRQLGTIVNIMEKGNGEVCSQISELTVHMAGDAKETRKLLAMQVDEQKGLKETLESYNIEERLSLAEKLHEQKQASAEDTLQEQRSDLLRTFTEQAEANNGFRDELQQLGGKLGNLFNVIEKSSGEVSNQLSELTVHMANDAKESHILLNDTSNNFRTDLQQLGSQLGSICNLIEKSDGDVCSQISELTAHLAVDAQESRSLLANQVDEQKGLRETLDSYNIEERLVEAARVQQRALSSEIDDFQKQRSDMLRTLNEQTESSNSFRGELQQLGRQLETIFNVMEKGNDEICNQVSELMIHMTADAKESNKLLGLLVNEQRQKDDADLQS